MSLPSVRILSAGQHLETEELCCGVPLHIYPNVGFRVAHRRVGELEISFDGIGAAQKSDPPQKVAQLVRPSDGAARWPHSGDQLLVATVGALKGRAGGNPADGVWLRFDRAWVEATLVSGTVRILEAPLWPERLLGFGSYSLTDLPLDSGDRVTWQGLDPDDGAIVYGTLRADAGGSLQLNAHAVAKGIHVQRDQFAAYDIRASVWDRAGRNPLLRWIGAVITLLAALATILQRFWAKRSS
jgi:hypothetical protein